MSKKDEIEKLEAATIKIRQEEEEDIVYGLISSNKFCASVADKIEPEMIVNDYFREIAKWAKFYWKKRQVPIRYSLSKVMRRKCAELEDDVLAENIERAVRRLDRMYDEEQGRNEKHFNVDYAIECAIKYLAKRKRTLFLNNLQECAEMEDFDEFDKLVNNFVPVRSDQDNGEDIFGTENDIVDYENEDDVLVHLPGAAGDVIGDVYRGDLVYFLGSVKSGKSHMLYHVGNQCARAGLKVLHLDLEQGMKQVRIKYRATTMGLLGNKEEKEITMPVFVEDENGNVSIEEKTKTVLPYSRERVQRCAEKFKRICKGGGIRVLNRPSGSYTVDEFDNDIKRLKIEEGYVPDVIIVDYADIMASRNRDYRQGINDIWVKLRGLAQEHNVAVFTASQTNREGYKEGAKVGNVAEDFRKNAHCTCVVSINFYGNERDSGIIELKCEERRLGKDNRVAYCTICPQLGRYVVSSTFNYGKNSKEKKNGGYIYDTNNDTRTVGKKRAEKEDSDESGGDLVVMTKKGKQRKSYSKLQ